MIERVGASKEQIKVALKNHIEQHWKQRKLFGQHYHNNKPEGPNISLFLKTRFNTDDLSDMDLSTMNFNCANLQYVKFDRSLLSGSNFNDASLFSCSLQNCIITQKTYFNRTSLVKANFDGSRIKHVNFTKAVAHFAQFNNCILNDACFKEADCFQASFINTTIKNSNFEQTNLSGVIVKSSSLSKVELKNADLHDAKFSQCMFGEQTSILPFIFKSSLSYGAFAMASFAAPMTGMVTSLPTSRLDTDEVITRYPTVFFSKASNVSRLILDDYFHDIASLEQRGAILSSQRNQ